MPPDEVTLREFIEQRFQFLERELANLRSAIEKLAVGMVTRERFDALVREIEEYRAQSEALEERVDEVEAFVHVAKYVAGLIVMALMAIVVAWLKGVLGV